MLLRNPISSTKKFFQRTIDSFKSFITKGNMYERLPKTPPFHPFSCARDSPNGDIETGYKDLDSFYSEFTHRWDSKTGRVKNKTLFTSTTKRSHHHNHHQEFYGDSSQKMGQEVTVTRKNTDEFDSERRQDNQKRKTSDNVSQANSKRQVSDVCSRSVRERRLSSVAEKLKELEIMDGEASNVDNKQDLEEILHYYSRLTCPTYLDIVDKFFTEMCTEFFSSKPKWA